MSECQHEMIWVGSYTNLRCAKCNESYSAIQTEKVAQLEAELSECRAENERLRQALQEIADRTPEGGAEYMAKQALRGEQDG